MNNFIRLFRLRTDVGVIITEPIIIRTDTIIAVEVAQRPYDASNSVIHTNNGISYTVKEDVHSIYTMLGGKNE